MVGILSFFVYRRESAIKYRKLLFNRSSIGRNDFFVPIEGFLTGAIQASLAFIVPIDIDKTVALLHFSCPGRDQVNTAPSRITSEDNAIFMDGIPHCLDVSCQVINPVVIFNLPGFIWGINGA